MFDYQLIISFYVLKHFVENIRKIVVTSSLVKNNVFLFFKKIILDLCVAIVLQVIKPGKVHLQSTPSSSLPKAKIKTLKMTCVIVSVFLICGLPYFILEMIYNFGDHSKVLTERWIRRLQKAFSGNRCDLSLTVNFLHHKMKYFIWLTNATGGNIFSMAVRKEEPGRTRQEGGIPPWP